jgi:hypothetical protein
MVVTLLKSLVVLYLSTILFVSESCAQSRPKCIATFKTGELVWNGESLGSWIKGDFTHSVTREDGSTLWFFGNTIVNSPNNLTLEGGIKIPNSVGISECNEVTGEFKIRYDWGISDRMGYEPIFKPKNLPPKYAYKPDVPWFYHGFLFVPLRLIERVPFTTEEKVVGLHLARVLNPEREPSEWRISYGALFDSEELRHEQTIVSSEGYVYFITSISDGKIVSRVKKSETMGALTTLAERVEYLISNGNWKRDFKNRGLRVLSSLFLLREVSEGMLLKQISGG